MFSVGDPQILNHISPCGLSQNLYLAQGTQALPHPCLPRREYAHFPSHVWCPPCLGLLLESFIPNNICCLHGHCRAPSPYLPGISLAPHHIASHQIHLVSFPSMPQHFFLESPTASQMLARDKASYGVRLSTFSFSAGLNFLSFPSHNIFHLAGSVSQLPTCSPRWP